MLASLFEIDGEFRLKGVLVKFLKNLVFRGGIFWDNGFRVLLKEI